MASCASGVGAVKDGDFVVGDVEVCYEILEAELSAVFSDLIALLVLIVEELVGEGYFVVDHVLSAVVSHIEDLCVEAKPVQEAVDLLTDVGLSPRRHCLWARYVQPSRPPLSRDSRCKSTAS